MVNVAWISTVTKDKCFGNKGVGHSSDRINYSCFGITPLTAQQRAGKSRKRKDFINSKKYLKFKNNNWKNAQRRSDFFYIWGIPWHFDQDHAVIN